MYHPPPPFTLQFSLKDGRVNSNLLQYCFSGWTQTTKVRSRSSFSMTKISTHMWDTIVLSEEQIWEALFTLLWELRTLSSPLWETSRATTLHLQVTWSQYVSPESPWERGPCRTIHACSLSWGGYHSVAGHRTVWPPQICKWLISHPSEMRLK